MFITTVKVAERLGVSSRTVRRWAREGRLPNYPLGPRSLKFDEAEIERLLEMIKRGGAPERCAKTAIADCHCGAQA